MVAKISPKSEKLPTHIIDKKIQMKLHHHMQKDINKSLMILSNSLCTLKAVDDTVHF